ncbi:hypothetical protein [Sphingobium sp. EM0848]|uniref:hypothetical protein n=1 Tax=Sphingobium sp. EM0848 TaxID=2743473 RepID=UPI00159C2C1F|nr:hypothetical protein [Sphingobium sp. EM0848]
MKAARPSHILAFLPLLAAVALSLSYWPGLVTYDSVRQYDQALSGAFDDWHPPMMEGIWRLILPLWPGPAPMLLLQLGLYAAGMTGMIVWALRRGRPGVAVGLGLCTLLPLSVALMGEVLKDCLMAGALTAAVAMMLLSQESRSVLPRVGAAALVFFAATLRFNAFLAGVPILLLALGPVVLVSRLRMAVGAAVMAVTLLMAMPLANRALGAEASDVNLSLVIFDLAGITEHGGQDAFPPMHVGNPVAVVHHCYTPVKWDSFSWWVDPLCPLNFEQVRRDFHASHISALPFWLGQIVRHPIAYAQHRLAHWNINARFWVHDEVERPVQRESAPNDWNFHVTSGPALNFVDDAAVKSADTPLGWPCAWMALALGLMLAARRMASAKIIWMLAGSALFYGLGYAVFSVAAELRYYLWTMMAGAMATVIAIGDFPALPRSQRWRAGLEIALPSLAVISAATLARL